MTRGTGTARATARIVTSVLMACLTLTGAARAQDPPDPAETARVRIGPLSMNPTFEIKSLGIDSNVFNEAGSPKSDFTATFSPKLESILRAGLLRVTSSSAVDVVYFRKYTDEQSLNRSGDVRVELRFDRFRPFAQVRGLDSRERPNTEIDRRARHTERGWSAGADLFLTYRVAVRAAVRRNTLEFDPDEEFRGENLARRLNQRTEDLEGGMRFVLTPFTTLDVNVTRGRLTFPLAPDRDAHSLRVGPELTFNPSAVIAGTVMVGYRQFETASADVPDYRGLVAAVRVSYSVLGQTRFDGRLSRDVQYSFEAGEPFYLLTAGRLTVTQLLAGPLDVQGVVGRDHQAYRALRSADRSSASATTDVFGGGIGFRFGETARLGVNAEYTERRARPADRAYSRRRVYAALTYGF